MDLDSVWEEFISKVAKLPEVKDVTFKKAAGIPFLYIVPEKGEERTDIEKKIRQCSSEVMKGKRLSSITVFVRSEPDVLVFRHRFYVPQRKMFCCGNLCIDCVRLNPNGIF